ncbi:MAG TPA: hypothetical protein VG433_12635, partial [Pirellulales bacterium]|nr:hypothetical protein [Pirellulales bacterium]
LPKVLQPGGCRRGKAFLAEATVPIMIGGQKTTEAQRRRQKTRGPRRHEEHKEKHFVLFVSSW